MTRYLSKTTFQNILLGLALLMTFASGSWLWVARGGWTLLAILCALRLSYAIYSIFFFASFFIPTGFLPNLVFTVKHFHIIVFICITIQMIKNGFWHSLGEGWKKSSQLYPVLFLVILSIASGLANHPSWKLIRSTTNLTLVLFCIVYLTGFLLSHRNLLRRGLCFFIFGVALQVLLGFFNRIFNQNIFTLNLIHNNHIGVLTAFSIFYGIALTFSLKRKRNRYFAGICTLVLFSGLIFSCSRTSWLSFLGGFVLFCILMQRYAGHNLLNKINRKNVFVLTAVFGVFIGLGMFASATVRQRVTNLHQLLDFRYWNFTLHDYQNFGFLGIYRLEQFYRILEIERGHLFFGIGFAKEVTEFHGMYFTILGATGIVGLGLFALFCRNLIHELVASMKIHRQPRDYILRTATLCAFAVWLFCSFMETLFLQYAVWINVLTALLMIHPPASVRPKMPRPDPAPELEPEPV